MLRSLVGSEMCIRDRGVVDAVMYPGTQAFMRWEHPSRLAAAVQRRALEVCLLYTSDAADDLLCVDLGGRRIIKKKKSTKQ